MPVLIQITSHTVIRAGGCQSTAGDYIDHEFPSTATAVTAQLVILDPAGDLSSDPDLAPQIRIKALPAGTDQFLTSTMSGSTHIRTVTFHLGGNAKEVKGALHEL